MITITKLDRDTAKVAMERFLRENQMAGQISRSEPVKSGKRRDRVERIIDALRSANHHGFGYLALGEGRIIGAVSYRRISIKTFAELYTSCTDFWSNDSGDSLMITYLGSLGGAGAELVKAVENEASALSVPVLLRSTPESVGFYRKLGYQCRNGTCRKQTVLLESLLRESQLSPGG